MPSALFDTPFEPYAIDESAHLSDYHWESLSLTPDNSPAKELFGSYSFGFPSTPALTVEDSASETNFEIERRNSAGAEFPTVPVFRKAGRSMSQPCIFFPSLTSEDSNFGSFNSDHKIKFLNSFPLDETAIEEEEEVVFDYEPSRRRMSTPAIFTEIPNCHSSLPLISEIEPFIASYKKVKYPSSQSQSCVTKFVAHDSFGKSEMLQRRHSAIGESNYKCPWPECSKVFTRFYNLKSHYRCHSGEKPFKCEYCPSSFARNHDLKRHERKHSGDKPFICKGCNKGFSRNDAMNRHMRMANCDSKSSLML